MARSPLLIQLSPEDRRRLEALATKWEMSLGAAARKAIKESAQKEKV